MRPVSWRGLSSTEPCFVSVCIPNRLATSYRLALDFRPLCDNLLAALDAAQSASMSYSAARSFTRPATSEFVDLRVAIIHVLADATVSVLVIVGLLFGPFLGWTRMDPWRPHAEPSSSPLGPTDSCETLAPSSST